LLLRGVIAQLVPFELCEDAEKCRIAVRHPMAESEAANKTAIPARMELRRLKAPTAPTHTK